MTDILVKIPLISSSISNESPREDTVIVSYFVGDTKIMDAEIQKSIITEEDGEISPMTLTQLLVTPHEPLSFLDQVVQHSDRGELQGDSWNTLLSHIRELLGLDPKA